MPAVPAPSEPTGFRLRAGRQPPRTQRRQLGVLLVLLSVALLLFGSAQDMTPQLADARAGSARVVPVTVEEVISRGSTPVRGGGRTYTSKLTAAVNDGDRGRSGTTLRGTIKTSDSVRPNDELRALYSPGRSGGEAQLGETQSELAGLLGGDTRPSGVLLGVCTTAAALGLLLLSRRTKRSDESEVAEALRTGGAQAFKATLSGTADEGKRELGVGVRLTGEDGERQLYICRFVDVEHLVDVMNGRTGWLYWARPGDGDPPGGRPGEKGEMLPAVLILGDGEQARYVRGRMPREPDWPVAQGRRLGKHDSESCPDVAQLDPYAVRPPRVRLGAVVWLGLAVLAASAAMAFPVGVGGKEPVQVVIVVVALCTVIGMRLREAKWGPSVRRQEQRTARSAARPADG